MKTPYLLYLRRSVLSNLPPERLAEAASISRADAMRVLKSRAPQAVAVCDSADEARERLRAMRGRNLEGFAITPGALRRFQPRTVELAVRQADGILWSSVHPPFHAILGRDEVRMIVVGKIHTVKETSTRGEMNPIATAGLGMAYMGGPAAATRLVPYETTTRTRDEESFCCLFRSADEAYLIREAQFRYRETLPTLPLTREQSFLAVVRLAREAHPGALFDDALYRFPASPRLLGGGVRNLGKGLVDVVESTREGSTFDRAMSGALLIFLQATSG